MDVATIAFVIAGVLLIASEAVVPSLVGAFLGVAALLTAGLRGIGVVESVPWSLLVWSALSVGLIVPFRPLVQRLVPGRSEARRDTTDVENERDAMGEIVTVVEDVDEDHDLGRIRFRGTTWQARSTSGKLRAGQEAQLVYRDGTVWIIEPVAVDGSARALFEGEAQSAPATAPAEVDKRR